MTVVVVFHGHIFIPASSENSFIGGNILCFMQCLLCTDGSAMWSVAAALRHNFHRGCCWYRVLQNPCNTE